MNLSLLLLLPLMTAVAVLCCKGLKQVRAIAFSGAVLQLILAFVLLVLLEGTCVRQYAVYMGYVLVCTIKHQLSCWC